MSALFLGTVVTIVMFVFALEYQSYIFWSIGFYIWLAMAFHVLLNISGTIDYIINTTNQKG